MRRESPLKSVPCPTCKAALGEMCGRERFGAPGQWQRTSYHTERIRLYNNALRVNALFAARDESKEK